VSAPWWVPVAALVVGFFVREVSDYLRRRRVERAPLGQVLADLLEMRHRLLAVDAVIEMLKVNAAQQTAARAVLDAILPRVTDAEAKYDAAVRQLAGTRPLDAFGLRAQDMFPVMMANLRALALQDAQQSAAWPEAETLVRKLFLPHLESTIRSLAWSHSVRAG